MTYLARVWKRTSCVLHDECYSLCYSHLGSLQSNDDPINPSWTCSALLLFPSICRPCCGQIVESHGFSQRDGLVKLVAGTASQKVYEKRHMSFLFPLKLPTTLSMKTKHWLFTEVASWTINLKDEVAPSGWKMCQEEQTSAFGWDC